MEREVARSIRRIEGLLQRREEDGFMLGDTDFAIECVWVKDVQKHHVAVNDLKQGGSWVASLVFEHHPTMTVEEVKRVLKSMGFGEYGAYALGMTNDQTVGEYLVEVEDNLNRADREEWVLCCMTSFFVLDGYLH